jgi:hypothetical protein
VWLISRKSILFNLSCTIYLTAKNEAYNNLSSLLVTITLSQSNIAYRRFRYPCTDCHSKCRSVGHAPQERETKLLVFITVIDESGFERSM